MDNQLDDQDFEDQAAIQIIAALVTIPESQFQSLLPQNVKMNPAGYALKAYELANALVQERRDRRKGNRP
jgi:hypothetical protein